MILNKRGGGYMQFIINIDYTFNAIALVIFSVNRIL
jgi:hypothetical protein